jgi:hypothetical protein
MQKPAWLIVVLSVSSVLTDELPAYAEKASAGEGGESGIRTRDTL